MEEGFDAVKFRLGPLCKNRHDWNGTGTSLRYRGSANCVACRKAWDIAKWSANYEELTVAKRKRYWKNRDAILVQNKVRYKANAERHRVAAAEYCRKNPGALKAIRQKRQREKGDDVRAACRRSSEKRRQIPANRLYKCLSSGIRQCLMLGKQGWTWQEVVGYTVHDLKAHLEAQFTPEMTWENFGVYWHIDHVIPLSAFACTGPDDPMVKQAWALSNLRPLEAFANKSKGNKLMLTSGPARKRRREKR